MLVTGGPYTGPAITKIHEEEVQVSVTIETDRLILKSVTEDDIPFYQVLFSKPEIYPLYGSGERQEEAFWDQLIKVKYIENRLKQKIPLGGLVVWKKGEEERIGHAVLGVGEEPGEGHIAFALDPKEWNKGYATEMATALIQGFGKRLWQGREPYFEGKPLEKISATSFLENKKAHRVIEKGGLEPTDQYPTGAIDQEKKVYFSKTADKLYTDIEKRCSFFP